MPYSVKADAILRVEKLLEAMLIADDDIAFPTNIPHILAYRIHNAISVAANFDEYKKYAGLGAKFKVRVRSGKVVCELRSKAPNAAMIFKEEMAKMKLEEIENSAGIVGAMIHHKADEIYFPDAILSEGELTILYQWTSKNGYFIVNHEDAGVTVTKERTGVEWQPTSV